MKISSNILCSLLAVASLALWGCGGNTSDTLPIMGKREAVTRVVDGKEVIDTVYHQIGEFAFMDQDSSLVTHQTFSGKLYVADFFFTQCPTICPRMQDQLFRVYERFKNDERVMLLSHSIDPERDSIPALKLYSQRFGADANKWKFVTGEKEVIYRLGQENYMVTAYEDQEAPGGFMHSGTFILVDKNRHVRGFYNGLERESVDKLMADMEKLLRTEYPQVQAQYLP